MREVFIDLSPDSHLQEVKVFGGYSGEQNETLLKIKLPERMISNDFLYYYFKFETDCNEEILSVPIPYTEITNSIIETPLWQQLTKNGFLKVNVVASNGIITESPSRIAMTNTIVLAIKKSPNGQKVFIDPNAVELQLLQLIDERVLRDLQNLGELVVDQTYTPTSPNAQSGIATAEAVGVANDYTDKAIKSSKNYANNTFAPAIKNTVSGGVLAVHDVSPVEHDLGVSVRSKNLWTNSKRNWGNDFTVTFEDSNNITATANGNSIIPIFEWTFYDYRSWGNSITVSFDYEFVNSADDVARPNEFMCFGGKDGTNTFLGVSKLGNDTAKKQTFSGSYTIDTDADYDCIRFGFYGSVLLGDFENYQVTLTNMQLELGTTATDYTPYVADLSAVGVSRLGKNLYNLYDENVKSQNGVNAFDTIVKKNNQLILTEDNSVLVGNMPVLVFYKSELPKGTYILSYNYNFENSLPVAIRPNELLYYADDTIVALDKLVDVTEGTQTRTITLSKDCTLRIDFYQHVNSAAEEHSSKTIYKAIFSNIQLEVGSTATDYEPYIEPQTVTANADGTVEGLTSLSLDMTVMTNTEGVVIDMTYNADTKMYIDNKISELL